MADELTSLTIAEAADLIRDKKLSPVELTQAYLDRIEKIDPLLNSYITVTQELALEQARRLKSNLCAGNIAAHCMVSRLRSKIYLRQKGFGRRRGQNSWRMIFRSKMQRLCES